LMTILRSSFFGAAPLITTFLPLIAVVDRFPARRLPPIAIACKLQPL